MDSCWPRVNSSLLLGLDAVPVEVEVDISTRGPPHPPPAGETTSPQSPLVRNFYINPDFFTISKCSRNIE